MARPVVVDTNILFSALLKQRSSFSEVLLTSDVRFYINELVFAEITSSAATWTRPTPLISPSSWNWTPCSGRAMKR